MKATINLVSFFFLFLLVACGGPEGKKVEATDAKAVPAPTTTATTPTASANAEIANYNLNKGTLNWTGSKLAGSSHSGTISVVLGDIKAKGDNILSGQFVIDMKSITNTDMEAGKGKEKLEGHLKNADFFNVEAHPRATFIITGSKPATGDATHTVTGNLTIKGITKSVSIPVNVAVVANKLTAVSSSFVIDRTEWGIKYGSSSIAGLAKDKIISNDIALVLNLEATANAPAQ